MDVIQKFGQFEVSRRVDGRGVELTRSPHEVVFLAFDTKMKRLVELHIVKGGSRLQADEKEAVYELAGQAASVRRRSFMRIFDIGEDEGAVYYSSSLNDGEALESYVERRGALPQATAYSLVLQLLEDLLALQSKPLLFNEVRLGHLYVSLLEDTFLQFFVSDYGLSSEGSISGNVSYSEGDSETAAKDEVQQRLVYETCLVIFLLLTGKAYAGDDCDRTPALTALPSSLRIILRSSLSGQSNTPISLVRLRDAVKDTLMAQARGIQGRNTRRHLIATEEMLPVSNLKDILLNHAPLSHLQKANLRLEGDANQNRYPFTLQATDARTDVPVTVHLLPPKRIVSPEQYEAVPLQMWRFTDEKHPNILRSRSVWESPDLTFLTEERCPGFPLSRLISERAYLNPSEVLILIRQVRKGVEQALDCNVDQLDLHASNITLRLIGAPPAREMDKLFQKRLDAWPKFLVMLRPHMTMRSLYEPLLVDSTGDVLSPTEHRRRAFIALTAYLLSGERQIGAGSLMPDSVPEELSAYIEECMAADSPPDMNTFLAGFEARAAIPEMEPEPGTVRAPPSSFRSETTSGTQVTERVSPTYRVAPMAAAAPAYSVDEMESAGSVSDFDDDEDAASGYSYLSAEQEKSPASSSSARSYSASSPSRQPAKGRFSLAFWASAVAVIMAIVVFFFSGWLRSSDGADVSLAQPLPTAPLPPPAPPQAAPVPLSPDGKPMTPEEIRRALLLSEEEKSGRKTPAPEKEGAELTLGRAKGPADRVD